MAAGVRLPVHLNISRSLVFPEVTGDTRPSLIPPLSQMVCSLETSMSLAAAAAATTPQRRVTRKEKNELQVQQLIQMAKKHVNDVHVVVSVLKAQVDDANRLTDKNEMRQAHRQIDTLLKDVLNRFSDLLHQDCETKTLLRDKVIRRNSSNNSTAQISVPAARSRSVSFSRPVMVDANAAIPMAQPQDVVPNSPTEVSATESCSRCSQSKPEPDKVLVPEKEIIYVADEEKVKAAIMRDMVAQMKSSGIEIFAVPVSAVPDAAAPGPPSPSSNSNLILFSDASASPAVGMNCTTSTNAHVRTPAAERSTAAADSDSKTLNTLNPATLSSPSRSSGIAERSTYNYTPLDVGAWRSFLLSIHPLVQAGDCIDASLSFYKSPSEFYMHHNLEESHFLCSLIQFKCMRMKAMDVRLPANHCVIGMLVLAKYPADFAWYRAEITDTSPEFVEVFFIDYGNTERVHRNDLLPLEDELRPFRMQAVFCLLNEYNESNSLHEKIEQSLETHLIRAQASVMKIVRKKKMGQFTTMPRFIVDVSLRFNDMDEEMDAFKTCLNPPAFD